MLLGQRIEATMVWSEGGVTAPVEMWIEYIIMALSEEQQKQVLDAVVAEVERRNEIIEAAKAEAVANAQDVIDEEEEDETE